MRDLFLQRLGNTSYAIVGNGFFREQLAADIKSQKEFTENGFNEACPLIALEGSVSHEASKRRGSGIRVYGVDERFWRFHGRSVAGPGDRDVFMSQNLAEELGAATGDSLLLRVEKFSEIPIESLHSRKEDLGGALRLTMRRTLPGNLLGEFLYNRNKRAFVRSSLISKHCKKRSAGEAGQSDPSFRDFSEERRSDR